MRKFTALIIPAAIAALALPTAPAQAQDYGPNTCLTGFVWREAFAGDVVCVPPSTRTRAKQDNAAATSRRDPSAGYGPFGCQQGYVWREARASDLVCVTPNIRSQAKADNAAAAARRNSIKVSAFSSGGRWQLNVSNINNGRAADRPQALERPHAEELDGERERQPALAGHRAPELPAGQRHVLPRPGPDLQARRPQPERQRELRPDRLLAR